MSNLTESQLAPLFRPFSVKNLSLPNRIVMAPMTRTKSPGGVPGPEVAAYYRRRAEGGMGLIVTEGTYIPHPSAGFHPAVPLFYGEASLAGWRRVADEVYRQLRQSKGCCGRREAPAQVPAPSTTAPPTRYDSPSGPAITWRCAAGPTST